MENYSRRSRAHLPAWFAPCRGVVKENYRRRSRALHTCMVRGASRGRRRGKLLYTPRTFFDRTRTCVLYIYIYGSYVAHAIFYLRSGSQDRSITTHSRFIFFRWRQTFILSGSCLCAGATGRRIQVTASSETGWSGRFLAREFRRQEVSRRVETRYRWSTNTFVVVIIVAVAVVVVVVVVIVWSTRCLGGSIALLIKLRVNLQASCIIITITTNIAGVQA